ncbi:MAG TPA: outer membrane lipoprotein chaperone LolA [Steroidobacteraceae bacterium]|nr:outer membrane lipoprotein chaperone LolA [Steroidobacteraceae bacterium]
MYKAVLAAAGLALVTIGGAGAAATEPPTPIDRYLDGLRTLRAEFTQRLVDARGVTVQEAQGSLVVQRPGRFRWEVRPAGAVGGQLLVADGRNLWFFDRDLEQVTVKPADASLTATPAMLLSGVGDIRAAFAIEPLPRSGGLDWVRVVPRANDADFRDARLGFDGRELKRMELNDKLGQSATLLFSRTQRNVPVDPAELRFTPPPGADLIGTPEN